MSTCSAEILAESMSGSCLVLISARKCISVSSVWNITESLLKGAQRDAVYSSNGVNGMLGEYVRHKI